MNSIDSHIFETMGDTLLERINKPCQTEIKATSDPAGIGQPTADHGDSNPPELLSHWFHKR